MGVGAASGRVWSRCLLRENLIDPSRTLNPMDNPDAPARREDGRDEKGRITPAIASEMGKRAVEVREANIANLVAKSRERLAHLLELADDTTETVLRALLAGEKLSGAHEANIAAKEVRDRVMGQAAQNINSKNVNVNATRPEIVEAIERLLRGEAE